MLHQDGSWDPFVPKKDGGKLLSFNSLITGFMSILRLSRNWTKGDVMRESKLVQLRIFHRCCRFEINSTVVQVRD